MIIDFVTYFLLYLGFAVASGFLFYFIVNKRQQAGHTHFFERVSPYIVIVLFALIIMINPVKLPTTFQEWTWILTYAAHMIALLVWLGVIIVTAVQYKRSRYEAHLIKLYTILFLSCASIVLVTELLMIPMESSSYIGALGMSFGQILLLKHIVFGGLFIYSLSHVFWSRRVAKSHHHVEAKFKWYAEVILSFIVIVMSSLLRVVPLPRNVDVTVYFNEPFFLFRWIFQVDVDQPTAISFATSIGGTVLFIAGLIMLFVLFLFNSMSSKSFKPYVNGLVLLAASVSFYSGVMMSIELTELAPLSVEALEIILAFGSAAFCH